MGVRTTPWLVKNPLNQTAGDSYTTVTSSAASTRRSSVGLNAQSLVNQAPRGLQPPSQPEPGVLTPGGDCTNVMHFDLARPSHPRDNTRRERLNALSSSGHCCSGLGQRSCLTRCELGRS